MTINHPIVVFGDSYSAPSSWPTALQRWADRLAYYAGVSLNNQALGSRMSADMAYAMYGVTPGPANVLLLNTNDAAIWGPYSAKRAAALDAVRALVAWNAAPSRVNARSMSVSGYWLNTPLAGNAVGLYNPPGYPGATLSGSVSGTAVYVQFIQQNGNDFQCEVRIDGVLVDTINGNGTAVGCTYVGNSAWPAARRYGGLSAGSHTVQLKPINAGQYAFIDAIYGSDQATKPNVVICKVPYRTAAGYAMFAGNSDANIDTFNAALAALVSEFAGDGLNVSMVDAGTNPATDLQGDGVHPAKAGDLKIEAAFKPTLV